jgi:hypothetical protein
LSARKARQYVKTLPDSTEKDPKDTSDRVFNKFAWVFLMGLREYTIFVSFEKLLVPLKNGLEPIKNTMMD